MTPVRSRLPVLAGLAFALATACGGRLLPEMPPSGSGGVASGLVGGVGGAVPGAAGGSGIGAASAAGGAVAAGTAGAAGGAGGNAGACGLYVVQCTDGIDNDGDGLVDYADPECLGALDNDESSFANGIPGDNYDACSRDCYFDDNTGMGDDNCRWMPKCDPASTYSSCPYDPTYASAHPLECSLEMSQSQTCVDRCQKMTANGCDCFGCCTVPGLDAPVRLEPSCTAADFGDPTKCPRCTQVIQCLNPCGHCEICIGKPTLPADCQTAGGQPPYECPGVAPACGRYGITPSQCPCGTSCVTGCCLSLFPLP